MHMHLNTPLNGISKKNCENDRLKESLTDPTTGIRYLHILQTVVMAERVLTLSSTQS